MRVSTLVHCFSIVGHMANVSLSLALIAWISKKTIVCSTEKEFLTEPSPENTCYTIGVFLRKCNDFQNKRNNRQIFE